MTPRERRVIAGGAAISFLAFMLLRGAPMAQGAIHRLDERVRMREVALVRLQRDVDAVDSLMRASDSLTDALAERRELLVQVASAAAAQAEMLDLVRESVDEADATLEQATAIEDSTRAGRLRRATCRVAVQTDTEGLAVVLSNLATTDMLLEVTSIKVAALDPRSAPGQPERLHVELAIAGWFDEQASPDSAASAPT
jgi:hypothetical protein